MITSYLHALFKQFGIIRLCICNMINIDTLLYSSVYCYMLFANDHFITTLI